MATTTTPPTKTEKEEENPTWPDLLGHKNWTNLLSPLNLSLRNLILRCGDFCQANYDSFINDKNSKYCGSSRYGKSSFFQKVMLESASDYEVSAFLYATARVSVPEAFLLRSRSRQSWDRESNWIGYIAVTSDERSKSLGRREIYVAWRGTIRDYEWINVFGADLESVKPLLNSKSNKSKHKQWWSHGSSSSEDDDSSDPKAMLGWVTIYTSDDPNSPFTKLSARKQLLTKIQELIELHKDENPSVVLTGHSLGASLAVLSAFDLAENAVKSTIPVTAIVFGCPQIGNKALDDRIKNHSNLKILHVKNTIDVLTHYPGVLLGYVYTGTELVIDTRKSPSLKESNNPGDWHNLQAMLHVVGGWNGEKGEFEMRVKRSLALVNKSCDFLKDECLVPGSWWVEKNKGMVKMDDGEWVMDDSLDDEDIPLPEF